MRFKISNSRYKKISGWFFKNDDLPILITWTGVFGLFCFGLLAVVDRIFPVIFYLSAIITLFGLLFYRISCDFDKWVDIKDSSD